MRIVFISFLVFIVLLLSCGSDDGPTGPDPALHDTTHYPTPDKLCALTFDDGPDVIKTSRVLEKLEYYQVVATFFVVGQNVNDNTEPVLRRVVDSMGCEIGNHSYGYESMTTMTAAQIVESISKTDSLVEEYAGVTPNFFRPPNLAVNGSMYQNIDLPFASGVLGYDWQGGAGDTPQKVVGYVLGGMRDGAIILLHDVQPDPHPTPEALDSLIPALKYLGYEFVTLSDLFDRKSIDPDVEKMWVYVEE